MTDKNGLIARLKQHVSKINRMLNPGLKQSGQGQNTLNFGSISKLVGGKKYLDAANKMRALKSNDMGMKSSPSLINFQGEISKKYESMQKLIRLSPKSIKDSTYWPDVKKVYFNPLGGNARSVSDEGSFRKGSVIQSIDMFPKPGQSIEGFKEQSKSFPTPKKKVSKPKKILPRPKDRLFSSVKEIKKIPDTQVDQPLEVDSLADDVIESHDEKTQVVDNLKSTPKIAAVKKQKEDIKKSDKELPGDLTQASDQIVKSPKREASEIKQALQPEDLKENIDEKQTTTESPIKKLQLKTAVPVKKKKESLASPLLKAKASLTKPQTVQRQIDKPITQEKIHQIRDTEDAKPIKDTPLEIDLIKPDEVLELDKGTAQESKKESKLSTTPLSNKIIGRKKFFDLVKKNEKRVNSAQKFTDLIPMKKKASVFLQEVFEKPINKVQESVQEVSNKRVLASNFENPVSMVLPQLPQETNQEVPERIKTEQTESQPQLPVPISTVPEKVSTKSSSVVQRLWEEHGGTQSDDGGSSQPAGESDEEEQDIDLDKLAEEIYPLVKNMLEIEAERISSFYR